MSKTVVGKLYMIGCTHCNALNEPWKQMIKKVNKNVIVADDIEAAQTNKLNELNKEYNSNVSVQGGYPTIYKIVDGKVEYYNGERTAAKLVSWALHRKNKTIHRRKKIMRGKSRRRMQRNN